MWELLVSLKLHRGRLEARTKLDVKKWNGGYPRLRRRLYPLILSYSSLATVKG